LLVGWEGRRGLWGWRIRWLCSVPSGGGSHV